MTDNEVRYVTPSVLESTNFKEFFLKYDGLENLKQELVFSVFKRYMCKAGCKMCYLQNDWIADDQFDQYVPREIDPTTEERILEFFEFFGIVSTIDDLNYLKNKYDHLYQFYVRNSHRMHCTSMSDTAFVQQRRILLEEMNFKGIYEISFSDLFLHKKGGTIVDDLIAQLTELHAKTPISKFKVIICTDGGEKTEPVKRFVEFAHTLGIFVGMHDDILQGKNIKLDTEVADYQELNYYSQGAQPILVLSEIVYMQYTSLFLSLTDATTTEIAPYHDIVVDGIRDVDHLIAKTLQEKLNTYNRFCRIIDKTCDNKLYDYFSYVSSSVVVNPDFNFIPRIVLKPWTEIYKKLRQQGWIETQYGLLDSTCALDKVIPLFEITAKPRLRLHHIPIKNAPIFE